MVLVLELLHTPAAVDELLLPREERMAGRADVQADLLLRRPRLPGIAARASHFRVLEFGMNILFHFTTSFPGPAMHGHIRTLSPILFYRHFQTAPLL